METMFVAINLAVLPSWFLMIFLPHWRGTQRVMSTPWPILFMLVVYIVLLLPQVGELLPLLLTPFDVHPMAKLLSTPMGVTTGWAHFLALDLFAGRWAYLDSRERGFSAWWVSPVLFLTLMAGPLGLLLYVSARGWKTRV